MPSTTAHSPRATVIPQVQAGKLRPGVKYLAGVTQPVRGRVEIRTALPSPRPALLSPAPLTGKVDAIAGDLYKFYKSVSVYICVVSSLSEVGICLTPGPCRIISSPRLGLPAEPCGQGQWPSRPVAGLQRAGRTRAGVSGGTGRRPSRDRGKGGPVLRAEWTLRPGLASPPLATCYQRPWVPSRDPPVCGGAPGL